MSAAEPLGARHPDVRRLRELLRDTRARAAEQAFVVEGPHALEGALDRGAPITDAYLGPRADTAFADLVARLHAVGVRVHELKEGVLEKVGSTRTPKPVLAVAPGGDPIHTVENYRALPDRIPGTEFIVYEGLPHNITDAVPDRCAEDLRRFLLKHRTSTAD